MNEPPPPLPPPEGRSHQDFPVMLDVVGWRCLMVGGGPVAARRTGGLLLAGAEVTVVAPVVDRAFEDLARIDRADGSGPALAVERRSYRAGEAARYRLVVTATGRPEVDGAVVADAVAGGVLVNSATGAIPGTVRFPAVHRAGPVTLAVSTAGTSPALAAWLRTRVAAGLPPDVATIATLVDEVRTARQEAGRSTHSADWSALLDHVAALVEAGRITDAREVLRSAWPPPERG